MQMDIYVICLVCFLSTCHMDFQQLTVYSVAVTQNKTASVRDCFHVDSEKKVVNNNNDQTDCCIFMI